MKSIVRLAHVQVSDVGIYFSSGNVRVTQQRLHRARIRSVLHEMSSKAVAQSMWRDIRHACMGGVCFDESPGGLSRHPPAPVEEQLRLRFIAQSLAYGQISLQPVNRALANRNSTLLAAFPITGKQGGVDINVARAKAAHLRNAQARRV